MLLQWAKATNTGFRRMAELVEAYLDLPLGMVDAAVIATAGRLQLTEIATLDHRHFAGVQPSRTRAFAQQQLCCCQSREWPVSDNIGCQ